VALGRLNYFPSVDLALISYTGPKSQDPRFISLLRLYKPTTPHLPHEALFIPSIESLCDCRLVWWLQISRLWSGVPFRPRHGHFHWSKLREIWA